MSECVKCELEGRISCVEYRAKKGPNITINRFLSHQNMNPEDTFRQQMPNQNTHYIIHMESRYTDINAPGFSSI